jgi:purine-cytosine permease-like protein
VVFLAMSTGQFDPSRSDPNSVATGLGFGWGAYLVVLLATVATNAGNIYASALGLSQLAPRTGLSLRALLAMVATLIVPLSLFPLVAGELLASYIFFLDFVGALVVPLWTIVLVDFFVVRRGAYSRELFRIEGGPYWYSGGVHWPGVLSLLAGTVAYWVVGFGFPELRSTITATIPSILVSGGLYALAAHRVASPSVAVERPSR